ncbi:Gfo/Idh/MocA family protein [Nonomuraea sp. NPDC050556]|uniref:Gfo/Idh/MocA family protein n=1 Tax=Nonomuraea sp. NPDC050556 TaxID=3364369 RepID=UPI0037AD3073
MTHINLRDHIGTRLQRPATLAVAGAGARGAAYAEQYPDKIRIVAVAEPRDADHLAPAEAFASLGYDILLEKPIAPTEEDSIAVGEAAARSGSLIAVCHVMRYTPYTARLREPLPQIGEIVSVEHLEPIGWYHFAHSFVRGNWRREDEAAFALLAKACHDIDWLAFVIGRSVEKVSSFSGLSHFRPENKPAGAADRCPNCTVEASCPYSAQRMYMDGLRKGGTRGEGNAIP